MPLLRRVPRRFIAPRPRRLSDPAIMQGSRPLAAGQDEQGAGHSCVLTTGHAGLALTLGEGRVTL